MNAGPLLEVSGLSKRFPVRTGLLQRSHGVVQAVTEVTFGLVRGRTLGIVGESGSGKSTVARCVIRLYEPTAGRIVFDGIDITRMSEPELRSRVRSRIQMVFQDPYSSLDPRQRLQSILEEPLSVHRRLTRPEAARTVDAALDRVGLDPGYRRRRPHEFSGGQRQRIAIARALVLEPDLIIADEPVSSLDVSIQAQVIGLLQDLQAELGLAYIFISHDLAVVRTIADSVAVMYLGRIMEMGPNDRLFGEFAHPYTEALLSAVPTVPVAGHAADGDGRRSKRRDRIILAGDHPDPSAPPSGCVFHTRCRYARDRCRTEIPLPRPVGGAADGAHLIACHYPVR